MSAATFREKYPNITKALFAIGGWMLGCIFPMIVGVAVGYHRGHEAGRIEMKCAIFAIVEGLDEDPKPIDGTITLGCDKRGAK